MEFQVDMADAANQQEGSFSRYTGGRDGYVLNGASAWGTTLDLDGVAAINGVPGIQFDDVAGAPGSGACFEASALAPVPPSQYQNHRRQPRLLD